MHRIPLYCQLYHELGGRGPKEGTRNKKQILRGAIKNEVRYILEETSKAEFSDVGAVV